MNALELLGPGAPSADPPPCPYSPLIGSWDVKTSWYLPDGTTRESDGEWHFSWILGGWGIQDVLFARGADVHRRGTSIRCYDSGADLWRVVWMMPAGGEFVALIAGGDGDRIVQEGDSLDGTLRQRWTIFQITQTSFLWQGESSNDDGSTWRLDQEMRATRRAE